MMRTPNIFFWASSVLVFLFAQSCNGGFYPPGEPIFAMVDSVLTSNETEVPLSYYNLPYCKPLDGIKIRAERYQQIDSSPHRFRIDMSEAVFLCTTTPLSELEVKLLKQTTRNLYQVDMVLNNYWRKNSSFPVGYTAPPQNSSNDDDYYMNNHLKFKVFIHAYPQSVAEIFGLEADKKKRKNAPRYDIVGFEVAPCSVKYDPEAMAKLHMYDTVSPVNCSLDNFDGNKSQIIREQERVSFTYQVEFVKSDLTRPPDGTDEKECVIIQTIPISASLIWIIYMAAIVSSIFSTVEKSNDELDKEALAMVKVQLYKLKLVMGDVFREPDSSKLLCVIVGDGVQITGMAFLTIVYYGLGGMLLTGMIIANLLMSIVAGYVSVRIWRTIKGSSQGWMSVCCFTACFFPGIVFVILTLLNFLPGAIPVSLYDFLLFLSGFCISVPLTLLGGFIGTRAEAIQYPVTTNQIPREIPSGKYTSWLLVLGAGTFPFLMLFYHVLFGFCFDKYSSLFGFLPIILVLLFIFCALVSVDVTYDHLRKEDWRWWWKAFFASGSAAVYVFLSSIFYLVFGLHSLSGPVSVIVYIGYSLVMAMAIMLSVGSIGFLLSFYFMHRLFSSEKIR